MNPNNSTTWRQFLVRAGTAAALTALVMQPLAALAQSGAPWPTRPLRIIAGYPSGSSPDLLARLLAEHLGKSLGQSVIVENKPGASGNIGAELIAKADDGHNVGTVSYTHLTLPTNREVEI